MKMHPSLSALGRGLTHRISTETGRFARFGRIAKSLVPTVVLASIAAPLVHAQLRWSAYDQTGTLVGTAQAAATFAAATETYTFTVPAGGQTTFVTTNFIPITMSAPSSGTTIQTISYKMTSSAGWTSAVAGNRINQIGLFDYGASAPGATGSFTDDNGLFGNLKGGTWGNEVFGGTSTAAGLLGGYQSAIKLSSGKSAGSTSAWTLSDGFPVNITLRIALTSGGVFSLGTSSSYANAGLVVEDSAAVGAGTSFQAIYSGAAATVTAPKTFNEFAFYFRNDAATAATITLTNFSGLTPPPYFTAVTGQPPATIVGSTGDNLSIASSAVGSSIVYQWQKSTDGGATFAAINSTANPSAATATLTLNAAQVSDAGQYRVIISNAAGSNTSTVCTATVSAAAVGPAIQTDPQPATILVGGSNTFAVGASGTAPLTYKWQKSTDNGSTWTDISGGAIASYAVSAAQLSDAGLYRVVVTNTVSSATSAAAMLTVNQTPAFTTQPTGANLNPGDNLTLTAAATVGTPAPTYQWKLNNVAISGATNATYTISSATGANTGNYTVVATNAAGSATSATAPVTVLSTSLATSSLLPANSATAVFPDQPLTITFNAPIAAGLSGTIKIYDASSPGTPVDTIDFTAPAARVGSASQQALPVQSQTIGGQSGFNYYPVTVEGNTLKIFPRNGALTYNKTYYVTVDLGAIQDSAGGVFAGFSNNSTWSFSTKAAGPASGATLLTVANDGSGDFYTVQGAVDFVPADNTTATTIYVKNGTYTELVSWTAKSNLTFLGQSRTGVVIGYANNNNFNPTGTAWRAAFGCRGGSTGTVIANLTLRNTTPKTGSQAEVLYLSGSATAMQAMVTNVNLSSYQDTLLINGQASISDSYIEGDTDFMWGSGPVYFTNCELKALSIQSYYTQIRNPSTNHGFVYVNCKFSAADGDSQNPANPVGGCYLGRLDQNASPHTEVVLLNCLLGDHILGIGWNPNGQAVPAGTAATNCVEYNSRRIADNTLVDVSSRAAWSYQWTSPANDTLIANYSSANYVLGGTWTPALAPIITTQPLGATVTAGSSVSFSAGALGVPAVTYQWKKDGVDLPGATGATYTIASPAATDAGSYAVVVTNASGPVTSAAAVLAVNALATITTQPITLQAAAAGAPVTFSVAASGASLTYQWQKNGTAIPGATAATFTLANPRSVDSGDYTVVITNAAGSVTSSTSHLNIAPAGGLAWQSYDQTGARTSADAAVFDPATNTYTFTIAANSTATLVTSSFVPLVLSKPATGSNNLPVTFSMSASGGYGTGGSNQFHYTGFGLFNDGGTAPAATGNFTDDKGLWIELYQSTGAVSMKPQSVTSGTPFCPVSLFQSDINTPYGMGTGTGGALGTINDNLLVDVTVRPSALAAGTVQLGTSAGAVGTSGGALLDHATNGLVLNRRVYSSGSTGLSVASASITFNEFGYHFQNATDTAVTLQLSNFAGITTVPYFTTQPPAHGTVTVGDGITLTTVAAGGATTYQWQISTNGGTSFTNIDAAANASAATAALTLSNVQLADAAVYQLLASNAAGSVTSVPTKLEVTGSAFAPVIELQPMSATKLAGAALALKVTASATAPVTYQWKKNGTAIANATGATLNFATLAPADAGDYTVVVTNGQGSVTSNTATLVVQYVPAITAQPSGANVNPGATVNLSVATDALPAATYQWKKNNVAISGATGSTYTVASAAAADTGNYTVVVTNLAGNVTSAMASVNVLSSALTLSGSGVLQATSGGAYPETPITLNFSAPITAGLNGSIRIYDAANPGTPVDTISFASATARTATAAIAALPTKSKTIGTLAGFNYYPVTLSGSTATVYPANGALTYGKSYYVTIDPGVFVDATGLAFAGVSSNTAITLSTKSAGPATGTTVLTVAKDGSGDFCTVQAALDWVPAANTTPTRLNIKDGTYYEIVYWTAKDNLTLLGQSRTGTIVGYPNNNTLNPQGTNGRAAFEGRNATGTLLANLTVKNFTSYGGTQAEAIYFNNSDTSQTTITGVNLSSFQDTLNVNGPTYISDSYIEGDTDFMWGNGPVFFSNCELKMLHSTTFYTQVRNPATNHGFVYSNCLFSADTGVTGSFLGRLNQNAPAYTEVVLLNCREADTTLNPLGWDPNGITDRSNTLCVEYNPTKQSDATAVAVTGRVSWSFQWTSPANDTQIANYNNPFWVLNTQKDGTAKSTPTSWTPALAPIVVTQPAATSVAVGQAASLSVGAVGVPSPAYQWKRNEVVIAGATAATYTIPSVAAGHAGSYTVVVTNSAGSVTSSAAALTVAGGGAPTIDTPPSAKTATVGSNVTLTVTASGTAPLTYRWQKAGADLANAGRVAGAATATLTLTGVQLADAGAYTVVVTNAGGSTTSTAATLTVTVPTTPITPTIAWSNPAAITYGTVLGAAQLNASANTEGTFVYTPAAATKLGAGVQELSVVFTPTDTASYTSATKKVSLTVNQAQPALSWIQPTPIVAGTALSAAQLKATASVTGTFVYTPAAGTVLSAGVNQTLSATFTPADQTNYTTATVNTTITVAPVGPVITVQPVSLSIKSGATATFSVVATGTTPLSYQWRKDGAAITGANTATFKLAAAVVTDTGSYTVLVSNSVGSVVSDPAALTVAPPSFAGIYFGQFASGANWALYVRADNTGTFIAYLPQRHSALILQLLVNADGSFTVTGNEIKPLAAETSRATSTSSSADDRSARAVGFTLSGQITSGGVTGAVDGLGETFTGTVDTPTGNTQALAGFYTASAVGAASGATYVVVGANGGAFVLTTTPTVVGGGAGTISTNGQLNVTSTDSGQIAVTVSPQSQSIAATVTPSGSTTPIVFAGVPDSVVATKRLVNLSTRSFVGTGSRVLIVGFVVEGPAPKQVLVRAVGPALIPLGVSGVLAQPRIELHQGSSVVAQNAGWSTADNAAEIASVSNTAGAFALTTGSRDAALLVTLAPGVYSALVSGADGGTGVALVEVYEAPVDATDARKLVNLSGRGQIGTDSNTLIAGFVIVGNAPKQVLLRAIGPGLRPLGVTDAVAAVKVALVHNSVVIANNDSWGTAATAPTVVAAANTVGAFPLTDGSGDAALLVTLQPGVYSLVATGVNGAAGVALLEVYEVP